MTTFGDMRGESKYLAKEDLDGARQANLVTIRHFEQVVIEGGGRPKERKWIVYFSEFEKPMILNSTNRQLLMAALGMTKDSSVDQAKGKQIVIFIDPAVTDLKGLIVGGIRIRAAKPRAGGGPAQDRKTQHMPAPKEPDDFGTKEDFGISDDDVPF